MPIPFWYIEELIWWIVNSKIYFLKYWEGEEETNEIFVHEWAGAEDAVLSISKIPAGIIVKPECKNDLYAAVWTDENITKE